MLLEALVGEKFLCVRSNGAYARMTDGEMSISDSTAFCPRPMHISCPEHLTRSGRRACDGRAAIIRSLLLTVTALGAALPAAAQTPRIEVSGGYQYFNVSADLESIDTGDVPIRNVDQSLPLGWYVDLAGNLNRHFGIVFATGGNYKSINESATFGGLTASASADLRVHEFMGGVRYSSRSNPTVVPFGQFLVGAINGSAKVTASGSVVGSPGFSFSGEASGTDIALQAGGGMQLRLADKFGVRVGADYIRFLTDEGGVNGFRFGAGVVLAR
jgi:hypothetical protein